MGRTQVIRRHTRGAGTEALHASACTHCGTKLERYCRPAADASVGFWMMAVWGLVVVTMSAQSGPYSGLYGVGRASSYTSVPPMQSSVVAVIIMYLHRGRGKPVEHGLEQRDPSACTK